MYNGDFTTGWTRPADDPIYDPTTQTNGGRRHRHPQRVPGNIIPKSLFDPTVVKALAAFRGGTAPLPNTGAAPGTLGYVQNNYLVSNGTEISPNTKISVKGDHIFSAAAASRATTATTVEPEAWRRRSGGTAGLFRQLQRPERKSDVFRFSWDLAFRPPSSTTSTPAATTGARTTIRRRPRSSAASTGRARSASATCRTATRIW